MKDNIKHYLPSVTYGSVGDLRWVLNVVLIYFALKYHGDWNAIFNALEHKERIPFHELTKLESSIATQRTNILTILDHDYPTQLKTAYKPPFVLWMVGQRQLLLRDFICLTGNQLTPTVANWINSFVPVLTTKHALVTTMLQEIDKNIVASSPSPSVTVSAEGLEHCALASATSLVISEYPDGTKSSKDTLRARNRIVAALACSLVLFSSERTGGINNLVSHFLDLGKEIYCLPGDGSLHDGNSELIKQGAHLVTVPTDIDI